MPKKDSDEVTVKPLLLFRPSKEEQPSIVIKRAGKENGMVVVRIPKVIASAMRLLKGEIYVEISTDPNPLKREVKLRFGSSDKFEQCESKGKTQD